MVDYKFGLSLLPADIRPVFRARLGTRVINFLYDSGANMSVFVGMSYFKTVFKDFHPIYVCKGTIGGFGGDGSPADIFRIPTFYIADHVGNGQIFTLNNLCIAVLDKKNMGVDFILASPVFAKMGVLVDLNNQLLTVRAGKSVYNYIYTADKISVCTEY